MANYLMKIQLVSVQQKKENRGQFLKPVAMLVVLQCNPALSVLSISSGFPKFLPNTFHSRFLMQLPFLLQLITLPFLINAAPVPGWTSIAIDPSVQILRGGGAAIRPSAVNRASVVTKAVAMPQHAPAYLPKTNLANQFALRAKAIGKVGAQEYLEKNVEILQKAHDAVKVQSSEVLKTSMALQAKLDELEKIVADVDHPSADETQIKIRQEIAALEQKRNAAIAALKEPKIALRDASNNVQATGFHALEQADDTPLSRMEARKLVPFLENALAMPPAEEFMKN